MKPENDVPPLGPVPPRLLIILDGPEEINLAKFPELANGQQAAQADSRQRNLTGDLLIIDGPEEINDKMFPS